MKRALIVAALGSLAACVQLPDILATEPVRSATFSGSHIAMAECIRDSVSGGKTEVSLDRSRIDVYDARKAYEARGLSHYAYTVMETGTVEFRKLPPGPLNDYIEGRFWAPVERCASSVAMEPSETSQ